MSISISRHVLWAVVVISLLMPWRLMAQRSATSGRVECTVFVMNSKGQSVVAGAKVVLSGPVELNAETDPGGKCLFPQPPR